MKAEPLHFVDYFVGFTFGFYLSSKNISWASVYWNTRLSGLHKQGMGFAMQKTLNRYTIFFRVRERNKVEMRFTSI